MGVSKMQKIEMEKGKALPEILIDLYPHYGSQTKLAQALGVSQSTISLWFVRYGLRPTPTLQEKDKP